MPRGGCQSLEGGDADRVLLPTLVTGTSIADMRAYRHTVEHLRERRVVLPTFAELAAGAAVGRASDQLADIDPDAPDPANLFRMHWYNSRSRRELVAIPAHIVLPRSL